jgi:hypothetical protein
MQKKPRSMKLRGDGFGRIPLPKDLCAQVPWLNGNDPIPGWLLLLSEGRFRLLSTEQVKRDDQLEILRNTALQEITPENGEPSEAEPAEIAAQTAKLFQIELRPHQSSSWRFAIPREMEIFSPPGPDSGFFVAAFSREGYWEIWYLESYKQAGLGPVPAAIRGVAKP